MWAHRLTRRQRVGADIDLLPTQCPILSLWGGIKDPVRTFPWAQEGPEAELGKTPVSVGRRHPLQLLNKTIILLTSQGTGAVSHSLYGQPQLYITSQWQPPLKIRGICMQKLVIHGFGIHPSFQQNGWKYVNKWIIFVGMFTRCWWRAVRKCLQGCLHQTWPSVYCLNCKLIECLGILADNSLM